MTSLGSAMERRGVSEMWDVSRLTPLRWMTGCALLVLPPTDCPHTVPLACGAYLTSAICATPASWQGGDRSLTSIAKQVMDSVPAPQRAGDGRDRRCADVLWERRDSG
jgi:hypothetical protein